MSGMDEIQGWFADQDDRDGTREMRWRPYLQGEAACIPLDIWFDTKDACEGYIREQVIGAGMLDG
jgi:hypothetical protein